MPFRPRNIQALLLALLLSAIVSLPCAAQAPASTPGAKPEIFPLSQVKPGMKGVAYTIFAGDQVEAIELEVIGIMPNLLGPKQNIILAVLKGAKVEHTGVVAGMSGSPVYIEGKLAGALSLRFGIFTKEPLAGITPIENVFEVQPGPGVQTVAQAGTGPAEQASAWPVQYPLPAEFVQKTAAGAGAYLAPIETPLVFSGFHQETLQRFSEQFKTFGMVATAGGTAPSQPDDADIKPGDMLSMVIVRGDLSLQGSCTVTAVVGDQVHVCGHPLFNFGSIEMPMARGRVLTTLASSLASVKLINAGGTIGTFSQDRLTAVVGRLGPAPKPGQGMIPVELAFSTPAGEKQFRFEVIEHPKLTPLLVTIAVFNGLVANTAYGEGSTFQLAGEIAIKGHSSVSLENMFAPTDQFLPDGMSVALTVQTVFARIYGNPYERAAIDRVRLRVTGVPQRRLAAIDSAWSEKSEVSPGEQVNIKVLLRPYRGAPVMREVPITIPLQASRSTLRIVVSDSDTLNRMGRFFTMSPLSRLAGLEQLITLLNRERRNNRLYVTLLQPTPTLLVEDKELPNAPLSQINVLDQRRGPGSSLLLRESLAGEWSVPMNQVIVGQYVLTIQVR